jgi:hypothetical protein
MTSRPKSSGIFDGLSSTAIFCGALNLFVSLSHRTEPVSARGRRPRSSARSPERNRSRLIELPDLVVEAHLREQRVARALTSAASAGAGGAASIHCR